MQNSETRICQNCKGEFVIKPEDFDFFKKIDVPPPTWCPECRIIRKMSWRNERALYRKTCDVPGHEERVVSLYPENSPFTVYDTRAWWSDAWDPLEFGRPFDFSKDFFTQFSELMRNVPRINVVNKNSERSEYCNNVSNHKDCYLEMSGYGSENVMYSNTSIFTKDSSDLFFVNKSEQCYELLDSDNCYKVIFGRYCSDCVDSYFLYDCRGCQNCFGCAGLRNKKYHIFNKPYSKEEYLEKIKSLDTNSFSGLEKNKKEFEDFLKSHPIRWARIFNSQNVTGDNIENSKNCEFCFDIGGGPEFGDGTGATNSKFLVISGWNTTDTFDCIQIGGNLSLSYELISGAVGNYQAKFSNVCWTNQDVQYTDNCHNSSHLFGCVGLRNKEYCILNKQYTKEEYEELIPRIKKHMSDMPYTDQKGRVYKYGEFFPPELSPFAYNETIAQEYFPLTKEEALEQGYKWKDPDTKDYQPTIQAQDLPDHIQDVDDSITKEIIACEHQGSCNHQCTSAYRIIPAELQFYQRMNLPLPRLCPNCRHYERLAQRNPLKLWKRTCMCKGKASENNTYANTAEHSHKDQPCTHEFMTSYSPDREEIVYCEECYNREVV